MTQFLSTLKWPNDGKDIDFFVCLCGDVLLEVFYYGDRRRLTKLERVGRRFHWINENYFDERPFHCLCLDLIPRFLFLMIKL